MNLTLKVIIFALLMLHVANSQTIHIFKQWHLPAKVETTDIELSKKLAQYQNQKDLFEKLNSLILDNKVQALLSEGCEKIEIDEKFKTKFNGWSYELLVGQTQNKNYVDIMTLLPLKVEALHKEKIKTLCVDDLELIHESELLLSDLRAYVGYSTRLEEFKKNSDDLSYNRYANSLLSEEEKAKKDDPLEVARKKALDTIAKFELVNHKREQKIVKNILELKLPSKSIAILVIGGVHAQALSSTLKNKKINVETYTPAGYVENDTGLIDEIKRKLK